MPVGRAHPVVLGSPLEPADQLAALLVGVPGGGPRDLDDLGQIEELSSSRGDQDLVRTIEGLAGPNGQLDPIQEAFIEENAFQCGYCTPGMLMMTRKLLDETPAPNEADVRDYLKGNHCRCTGYASIVRAVQRASGEAEV